MTVAELIALLQTKPQELPVTVWIANGCYREIDAADVTKLSALYEPTPPPPVGSGVLTTGPHVRIG